MFLLDQITDGPFSGDASSQCRQKCKLCVCMCVCATKRESERERLREREREEEKAHKQGLQSILASINQLRKERVEFAYPPPVWEAGRERGREGGTGAAARSPDMDGKGWEGDFPKKRKRSGFLNGLNRTRMREEETVGEEVVREEGEVWDFLK